MKRLLAATLVLLLGACVVPSGAVRHAGVVQHQELSSSRAIGSSDLGRRIMDSTGFEVPAKWVAPLEALPVPPVAMASELAEPCSNTAPSFASQEEKAEWVRSGMSPWLLLWAVSHDGARAGNAREKGCFDLSYAARRWQAANGKSPSSPLSAIDIEKIDQTTKVSFKGGFVSNFKALADRSLSKGATLDQIEQTRLFRMTETYRAGEEAGKVAKQQIANQASLDSMPALAYLPPPTRTYTSRQCSELTRSSVQSHRQPLLASPREMKQQMAVQDQLIAFFVQTPEIDAWTRQYGIKNCPLEAKAEVWAEAIGVANGSFADPAFVKKSKDILSMARQKGSEAAVHRVQQTAAAREAAGAVTIFGFELGAPLNLPECGQVQSRQVCFDMNLLSDNSKKARSRWVKFPAREAPGIIKPGSFATTMTVHLTNGRLDGISFEVGILSEAREAFRKKFGKEDIEKTHWQNQLGAKFEDNAYHYAKRNGVEAKIVCSPNGCFASALTDVGQAQWQQDTKEKAMKGRQL